MGENTPATYYINRATNNFSVNNGNMLKRHNGKIVVAGNCNMSINGQIDVPRIACCIKTAFQETVIPNTSLAAQYYKNGKRKLVLYTPGSTHVYKTWYDTGAVKSVMYRSDADTYKVIIWNKNGVKSAICYYHLQLTTPHHILYETYHPNQQIKTRSMCDTFTTRERTIMENKYVFTDKY